MTNTNFKEKYGSWAIITGASAGIGAEFAHQIAAKGLHVVLVARRVEKLEALAAKIEATHHVQTRVVPLDLTTAGFETTLRAATADLDIGLLINNAGVAELGNFTENSLASELRGVDLNVRAPMILSHLYAQDFVRKGRGGIMFMGSMVGLVGVTNYANYAATKGYDLLLAEGLAKELRPFGVDVIGIAPGFTESEYTAGMDTSKMPVPMPFMKTPALVKIALGKLGTRTTMVIPGLMNQMMYWMMQFMGRKGSSAMMSWMIGFIDHEDKKTTRANRPVNATAN